MNSDNKRIAKNTVYMYARMFITMLIGLYTSRVILASLGFDDYGLYNVVGGIIAMFSFINGALSNTTSRYITFYLGKGNIQRLQEVFSTGFYIHIIIAVLIVVLGESIGLWYVLNKLVIPDGRFSAAIWLYQFTIVTTAINIISVPFNAAIIAHEKMSAFAIIAIIDSVLKLLIAISLRNAPFDRLVYYGAMILMVQLMDNVIYWVYSFRKFEGVRIRRFFDRSLFKEMFGFTGWNLIGNFSHVFFTQGINLIINFFCGTTVNAARGIAVQVDSVVQQFANNVQTPINPQIIKSYSVGDKDRMFTLIFTNSRFCFYLLFLLALPIILEAEFLLSIWLGEFPEHTISFIRITLITVTLSALVTPMFMANLASGKVKIYQIVMSVISLVFIPLSYFSIRLTNVPESVFICTLVMTLTEIVARIFIIHKQIGLPRLLYLKKVILNVIIVALLSSIIPIFIHLNMNYGVWRFLIVGFSCVLSTGLVVFFIGMNAGEKSYVFSFINNKTNQLFRKKV